eukprot:CAMPEP_0206214768 /NCGR_PEP_ID=MMETSP0047_2-20121206/1841_1 /ASSEMBLY_ACC=CAM_ASM_000192 /TAXON_ID=195065 /ORGANISM="Chroomonas mesostigmatica_cf, Strain CCMP1168" /LENGTH=137 /DNA_ID=CAMNT_0053637025 /DNA_START=529 /DNA_END=943 /DNA_ORIENTATION=-
MAASSPSRRHLRRALILDFFPITPLIRIVVPSFAVCAFDALPVLGGGEALALVAACMVRGAATCHQGGTAAIAQEHPAAASCSSRSFFATEQALCAFSWRNGRISSSKFVPRMYTFRLPFPRWYMKHPSHHTPSFVS